MTDAMLRLARAVYGDRAKYDDGMLCVWIVGEYEFPHPPKNSHPFDPANNADQFCDVLAWLTRHGVEAYDLLTCYESSPLFQNDGTAAGIRRAVVEAAMRVAK